MYNLIINFNLDSRLKSHILNLSKTKGMYWITNQSQDTDLTLHLTFRCISINFNKAEY